MQADFSAPKEFEVHSKALFKKQTITEREFVDFCLLACKLIDDHWDKRQGMAYHITGAWLSYSKNVSDNDILDQIGAEFGLLESPDSLAAYPSSTDDVENEVIVRKMWDEIKLQVQEADQKFSKNAA